MNKERLFRIIGQIDETLIENANPPISTRQSKPMLLKVGTIAACAVLVVSSGVVLNKYYNIPPTTNLSSSIDESSLLPFTVDFDFGAMGFEGYRAYSIDELVNENPWTEKSKITHLPVINNTLRYNEIARVETVDLNAMTELLKFTAKKLDMDIDTLPITDDVPDEKTKNKITEKLTNDGGEVPDGYFNPTRLFMTDENFKVKVDTSMKASVSFEPAVMLPKQYNFTHYTSTYDDYYKVAKFLQKEYKDYIDMKNPTIDITGGDYSIGEFGKTQGYSIRFFDNASDDVLKILNYNFNYVTFDCNDEGKLAFSTTYKPDLTNVVGNYPIITKEQALALLENNNFITTVTEKFPGMEYVEKVELIYRTSTTEKIYMPYYRIYVKLPSFQSDDGLNCYGAYYVPAVEGKYIENMPIWDGRFN